MLKKLKKLPVGLQGFREIIEDNYLYVDKTEYLYNLITSGKVYFLSRPRRFGKSLTCSTFEEIFAGNRELFKGLYIYNSDYEWQKHPVIKINFSSIAYDSKENFLINLNQKLIDIGNQYNINLAERKILNSKLEFLITELVKNFENKPVLIVDEYDYPLISNISKLDLAKELRDVLQAFYNTVKACSENLRFIFVTGISKFSKTSIFSSMNNLQDISLDKTVSIMFGYTKKEILENFANYLEIFSKEKKITTQQVMQELTEWYDGYCFREPPFAQVAMEGRPPFASTVAPIAMEDKTEGRMTDRPQDQEQNYKIFNPFSVLLALKTQNIDNYWFQSGTPNFLINLIKEHNYPILKLEEKAKINKGEMGKFEVGSVPLENLLFQTGYLTIKDYDPESSNFTLKFPNYEVRLSFTKDIIESMTKLEVSQYSDYLKEFKKSLFSNNLEKFLKTIHIFFADIPYDIQISLGKKKQINFEKQKRIEKYYQSIFYVTMKLVGADILVEDRTNIGRIDAVVKTNTHIYVIEFKVNKSAQEGMDQIHDRKYYEKFRLENKKLILIGLNFDLDKKNVLESDWIVQEL